MRLGIICSTFPLPGKSPSVGPENVIYNLVKGIIKSDRNISVDIINIRSDIKKAFVDGLFPNVRVHYYPCLKFVPRSFGDPFIIRNIFNKFDFDIVHSHYPIAISKILDSGVPIILTLHGLFHIEKKFTKNIFIKTFYHDYNTYMLNKILPRVDGFVAISPYIIDELKTIGLFYNIKNIFQINNPVDDSFFDVLSNPTDNIIFYPANITNLKNQMSAIDAIKLIESTVDNFKLIFAGNADKTYLEKVFVKIKQNGLSEVVEYKGILSRSNMLESYSKSSVVYLLSNQEVQPMVVLEAMSTGTPVIASNLKSISYLVEDGITGYLVDPNDSKKIAEYTVELFNNKEKRMKMGENARIIAQNQYHPEVVVEKTLEMYEEVMGSHNVSKL